MSNDQEVFELAGAQSRRQSKRKRETAFVDEVPHHLTCPICAGVFQEPVLVNGCGHEYCRGCLEAAVERKRQCPICRTPVSGGSYFTPLRRVSSEVAQLLIKCPNAEEGCKVKIALSELAQHRQVCSYEVVPCPHHVHGCTFEALRESFSTHLDNCPYEKLKPFVESTVARCKELEQQVLGLQTKEHNIAATLHARSQRLRQQHINVMNSDNPERTLVLKVRHGIHFSAVTHMRVKASTPLEKVMDAINANRGEPHVLFVDGQLEAGQFLTGSPCVVVRCAGCGLGASLSCSMVRRQAMKSR